MVIFGPSARILVTATQTPAIAATIGTSQTTESRVRFLGTFLDSGTYGAWFSGTLHLRPAGCIPDETGVERFDREHRQHHDCREEEQPGSRLDRHERLKLHECRGESVDEHVDHRPASDEFDHPVETDALYVALDRAPLHGDEKVDERRDLRARDHDARDEDDERERPPGGRPEEDDALQDRVGVAARRRDRREHREDVGRDVADRRGDEERPGALDARRLAEGELVAAARAAPLVRPRRGTRDEPAGLAALEAERERGRRRQAHVLASAHSTRSHTSRGSKLACIAASTGRGWLYTPLFYPPAERRACHFAPNGLAIRARIRPGRRVGSAILPHERTTPPRPALLAERLERQRAPRSAGLQHVRPRAPRPVRGGARVAVADRALALRIATVLWSRAGTTIVGVLALASCVV